MEVVIPAPPSHLLLPKFNFREGRVCSQSKVAPISLSILHLVGWGFERLPSCYVNQKSISHRVSASWLPSLYRKNRRRGGCFLIECVTIFLSSPSVYRSLPT